MADDRDVQQGVARHAETRRQHARRRCPGLRQSTLRGRGDHCLQVGARVDEDRRRSGGNSEMPQSVDRFITRLLLKERHPGLAALGQQLLEENNFDNIELVLTMTLLDAR